MKNATRIESVPTLTPIIPAATAPPTGEGLRVIAIENGLEIAVPRGWRVKEKKGIHKMTDADETMGIEFSLACFAPMTPGLPTVIERVAMARARTDAKATIHAGSWESAWFRACHADATTTRDDHVPVRSRS